MHFTFEPTDKLEVGALRQGDVLRRSEELDELLEEVHPHYFRQTDYRFLQVITQSCDLERRRGRPCRARYITLTAVRPVRTAIEREIDNLRRDPVESSAQIANKSQKLLIRQFVERLLNNNESAYFYIHNELSAGMQEAHCSFLRLSIAVRSQDHYETLLKAKVLQLRPDFQAKLGWLVGDMYSRVGTTDWNEQGMERDFDKLVEKHTDESTLWIEAKTYPKVVQAMKADPAHATLAGATMLSKSLKPPARREVVLARVRALLPSIGIEQERAEQIARRLMSDAEFAAAVRE